MSNLISPPHLTLPEGMFGEIQSSANSSALASSFKLQLSNNGVIIGYIGVDSSNWCLLVTDISQAATFSQYVYSGVNYYKVGDSYLSINHNAFLGLYGWGGACGWLFQSDGTFLCQYNNQVVSLYSSDYAYLYAWDGYTKLILSQV
jgi:hypothetical protein